MILNHSSTFTITLLLSTLLNLFLPALNILSLFFCLLCFDCFILPLPEKCCQFFLVLKFVFSLTCWLFFCICFNSSFFDTGYFYSSDCGFVIAVNSNYQSLKHRWALFLETIEIPASLVIFCQNMILVTKTTVVTVPLARNLKKIRAAAANIFKHILQLENLSNTIRFCIPWCCIFRRIATGTMSCHFLCKNFLIRVFPIYSSLLKIAQCKAFRSCICFFTSVKKLLGTRLEGFFFFCFSSELLNLDLMTNCKKVSHCTLHGISKVSLCVYEYTVSRWVINYCTEEGRSEFHMKLVNANYGFFMSRVFSVKLHLSFERNIQKLIPLSC